MLAPAEKIGKKLTFKTYKLEYAREARIFVLVSESKQKFIYAIQQFTKLVVQKYLFYF